VAHVASADRVPEMQRGGSDQEIGERDHPAGFPALSVESAGDAGHLSSEWLRGNYVERRIEIRTASVRLLRCAGPVQRVLQFNNADRGDDNLRASGLALDGSDQIADGALRTLSGDENPRVED
jgi:hypothetical protein